MAAEPSAASDAAMSMQPPPAPAPASTIINDDSPRKTLICNATANITTLRDPIAKEMDQEFVTADFDAFLAAYLPFVPKDTDVDACFERMLKRTSTNNQVLIKPIRLNRNSKRDKNKAPPTLSFHFAGQVERPRNNSEKKVFAKLTPIAEVISESGIEGRRQQYKFFDCPDVSIASDIAGSSNRIDASFVPVGHMTGDRLNTYQIAVACEWKLKKGRILENNRQVVSANVQMTNCDACRMFSFGISIDGNEMKLWHFSRSHSAVSEPVDYIQNPKYLIKTFMSFMFATPDEMGFDPTITRHSDGHFTYKLSKSERYFRSTGCISELRSNNITGRMTRVWSVKEVDSMSEDALLVSDHTYVLKDVWLDETARTEKEIQSDIFNDIEQFWDPSQKAREDPDKFEELLAAHKDIVTTGEYKKHFLTIEVDSTEQLTKNAVSSTRVFGLFTDRQIKSVSGSKNAGGLERNQAQLAQGRARPVESEIRRKIIDRDFAPKKQYRVVFKEKCETAGSLRTLGEVFDVVKQTLIPLQLMFCAGWVHRDISSGNVLAYRATEKSNWIAKLSDLEYAKKFPPSGNIKPHKDPKTGTPIFMATEILTQIYLYEAHSSVKTRRSILERYSTQKKSTSQLRLPPPVIHNFQHDLECLFWFLLWSMTSRVDHKASREYADFIFVNSLTASEERLKAFRHPISPNLSKVLIEPGSTALLGFMEVARETLLEHYEEREQKEYIFDSSAYIMLHRDFEDVFEALYNDQDTSWRDIKLELASSTGRHKDAENTARPRSGSSASNVVLELSLDLQQRSGSTSRSSSADIRAVSDACSSTNIELPTAFGKGKRRTSADEDSGQMPDPTETFEEGRQSKRLKLTGK